MKLRTYIAALFFLATSASAFGQPSVGYAGYTFAPQRVELNPALRPLARVNVSFPMLGSVQIDHGNNWLRPTTAFSDAGNGRTIFRAEAVLEQIGEAAVTTQSLSLNLFHIGIRLGKGYAFASANERVDLSLVLPSDLFRLAIYGNAGDELALHTADFSGLALDAVHFREYTLGYSREIGSKWSVGLAASYLYGMENIRTEASSLKLHTDPETLALQTSGEMRVNTAGLDGFEGESIQGYLTGRSNHGWGLSAGAVFRPIPRLVVHASVHDLGQITWKSNVANYGTHDATFLYDGFDASDYLFSADGAFADSLEVRAEQLVADFEDAMGLEESEAPYTTQLHGYAQMGAEFQLWEAKKLSGKAVMDLCYGFDERIPLRASVGYVQRVGNLLEAGVHLGKQAGAKPGLGAGLVLNAGFFQIHGMVENLNFTRLARVSTGEQPGEGETFVLPFNSDQIRLSLGVNLTFGKREKEVKD